MDKHKSSVVTAFRRLFRPIAKILLLAGIQWKEVAELGKATYVDVATAEFGIRGRPTNVSRVAILTGLTRGEVSRLRNADTDADEDVIERMTHATRVLTGWYTDPDFSLASGQPRPLYFSGDDASFEKLCRRFASNVPPTTMLKELKHVGAVIEDDAGLLLAQTRYYMPLQMDPSRVLSSGSVLEDLGNTVAYNLHRDDDALPRFERRATNTRMPADIRPAFQAFLEREGQAFLERVDTWLSEHELDEPNGEAGIRLGLGAYWIEE